MYARAAAFGLVLALFAGARAEAAVRVITSIPPLEMLVAELGGSRVTVRSILPAGADPHTFELRPSDAAAAAEADVVVLLGSEIDDWLKGALSGRAGASIAMLDEHRADDGHDHHGGHDPHCWLDPTWVREHALAPIHRALATADPAGAAAYGAAARRMGEEMSDLEDDIRTALRYAKTRSFLAWHPGWSCFAKRFDLNPVGRLGDGEGREPSLRAMIDTLRAARAADVRAVLIEPQIDSREPRVVADELGVPLITVDPYGDRSGAENATYRMLMMFNFASFMRALAVEKPEGEDANAPASRCGL